MMGGKTCDEITRLNMNFYDPMLMLLPFDDDLLNKKLYDVGINGFGSLIERRVNSSKKVFLREMRMR
jgi:hypothetical protein